MSKVFEALQRQQLNKDGKASERDPLAVQTGAPDFVPEVPELDEPYELPSVIGAPTGPKSNEGMIFPSWNTGPVTPPPANGGALHREKPAQEVAIQAEEPEEMKREAAARSAPERRRAEIIATPHEIPVEPLRLSALHPRLILLTEAAAPECEQYRTLRTQIFHAAEKRRTQVIVVTSAMAGEGKTSSVLNLALAIAQSKEKRVLVIDGDLRRPNVAAYLGLRPKTGLEAVLEGKRGALDSVFCLDGQELYVLPVGQEARNPTELLSSGRLDAMIEELRAYFDFILIDSPPVLPFADARLLANHSDALVMVVRSGLAPYETVEKAVEVLPHDRILGVVLNDADPVTEGSYYDYYYSYSDREHRRRSFWEKLKGRIGESWLGKRMHLD
ncbi:MAG: CpsD/CapB family tyrosine-protein kinase [Blastocatellia bacterium]|nr:CpsD/CapB family tyrosine-protein kinase [Blastocatellia bacterium]